MEKFPPVLGVPSHLPEAQGRCSSFVHVNSLSGNPGMSELEGPCRGGDRSGEAETPQYSHLPTCPEDAA